MANNTLFQYNEVKSIAEDISDGIDAPFVNVKLASLSTEQRYSIFIHISLDDKSEWINNIYHNSRYFNINIDPISYKMELTGKSYLLKSKFRKCTIQSIDDAINKINQYIEVIKKM